MKTHFKNFRRLLTLSAIAGPVLMMQAVFCFLAGSFGAGLLVMLLSVLVQMAFPVDAITKSAAGQPQNWFTRAIKILAFVMFFVWLQQSPDVRAAVNELIRSGAFLDWRLLVSVSLWTCYVCLTNWWAVRDLDDRSIYEFYGKRGGPALRN